MAALTTQSITRAGLGPTYSAATGGGDTCTPGANTFLHVKNGSGSPITVTITAQAGASQFPNMAYGNLTVSVPATTGDRMIGPLPASIFADPSTGVVSIGYSGVTSLTVAAISLSQP
jgi:hypothetical protein